MIDKIYGIEYDSYICGGRCDQKLYFINRKQELFIREKNMLQRLGELKENPCSDNFEVFTSDIIKKKYKL